MQPNEYSSGVSPVCGEATVRKSDRHGRGRRSPVGSVSRPVCVLPSPGLAASLTFSFFSSNNGAFRSVDAGGPTQICLVLHEEAKTILIGGAGVGAVSFGEQRGAQNIWWWPATLSARAGPVRPEPVKASSFALGWLMTLASPTRAGYAGNCVPWPHARPRVPRDRSRHGGMPCYVTMVTTCHLTNGF